MQFENSSWRHCLPQDKTHKPTPELRSNIYTIASPAPLRPTPTRLAPPAPCLHLTRPVFNPVSPTQHSSNASAARGDTKHALGGLKTRAWGVHIPLYAYKSASPGEKLALGAHLPPKPGLIASHPVDPSPLKSLRQCIQMRKAARRLGG